MGNGVFEPGETQVLQTAWINDTDEVVESILGRSPLFTGPFGADYTINDDTAFYDVLPTGVSKSCIEENDCFSVTVSDPSPRPVQHWDALFQEYTNMSLPHTWVLHLGKSFPDVPPDNTFYRFVETLFHKQVTGGCAGGGYCPTNPVTRAQMAVFLLKAKYGSAHIPPPCTGTVFPDVPCTGGPFDPWIEELAGLQITGGCGGGLYCPGNTVTRQQMAVFLLKAFEGSDLRPARLYGSLRRRALHVPAPASPTGSRSSPTAASPAAAPSRLPSTVRRTRTTAARWRPSWSRRSELVLYGG